MLLSCHIQIYGQSQSNKISNPLEELVSIYEYGENITSYETNFKNLLNNWKTENITNANEYEFVNISFVESISDSIRYIYYRNYFSGGGSLFIPQLKVIEEQVHINDKVYSIKFTYLGNTYTNYVICSSSSKKVVIDCFFKNIVIDK